MRKSLNPGYPANWAEDKSITFLVQLAEKQILRHMAFTNVRPDELGNPDKT
jgi:hypothetical protein